MKKLLLVLATTLILSPLALAANNNPCDRDCLKNITDQYFSALSSGNSNSLPFAKKVKYTENGALMAIGEGHWGKITGPESFRLQIFDELQGGIGTESVFPTSEGEAMMVLRLKVENREITEVESVVVYPNSDAFLYAPENLVEPSYFWTWNIRESERDTRHGILAAVESYWRAFESEGTVDYVKANLLPDTLRIEMGVQTTLAGDKVPNYPDVAALTAAEQFDNGQFVGAQINDRHYPVVDLETGTALAMVRFGGDTGDAVVGEFFAVTQGKIREIHAVFMTPKVPNEPVW